jgi:hypothetical protein
MAASSMMGVPARGMGVTACSPGRSAYFWRMIIVAANDLRGRKERFRKVRGSRKRRFNYAAFRIGLDRSARIAYWIRSDMPGTNLVSAG